MGEMFICEVKKSVEWFAELTVFSIQLNLLA
jgi:hypothetical protein